MKDHDSRPTGAEQGASPTGGREFPIGPYLVGAVFFLVLLNYHKIFNKEWLPAHDTLHQYAEFLYALGAFREGELPLWLSYLNGGEPFYILLNHALLLNPIPWIWMGLATLLGLHSVTAFTCYHLTDIIFFSIGGFLLVKEVTDDRFLALVAFIVLLYSGEACYWSNQIWSFTVIEYVPWVLWSLLRYFRCQTLRRGLLAAWIAGVAANVYMPVYLVAFGIPAVAFLLVFYGGKIRALNIRRTGRHALLTVPIAVLLCIPTVWIYLEITREYYAMNRFTGPDHTVVSYADRDEGNQVYCSKGSTSRLFPGMVRPRVGLEGRPDYCESVPLVGIMAASFMILGVASRNGLFWLCLLIPMLLNYLAWETPYHYLCFHAMPFYKEIRSLGFFSGFIILLSTVLACLGVQAVLARMNEPRKFWRWQVVLFGAFLFFALFQDAGDRVFYLTVGSMLVLFVLKQRHRLSQSIQAYRHLLAAAFLLVGAFNLCSISGLDFQHVRTNALRYPEGFGFSFIRPEYFFYFRPPGSQGEGLVNTYHIATRTDAPWYFANWGSLHVVLVNKQYYHLSEIPNFDRLMRSKLHLLRHYALLDDPVAQVGDFSLWLDASMLVLDEDSAVTRTSARRDISALQPSQSVRPEDLLLIQKTANTVTFALTAPEDVFLLYTDLYHPGFSAAVDGTSVPILRGMGAFKAIELSAGRHIVSFRFCPAFAWILKGYLLVALALTAFLMVWAMGIGYRHLYAFLNRH